MKPFGFISTSALLLLLGTIAPAYALAPPQQQDGRPPLWLKNKHAKGPQPPPQQTHRPSRSDDRRGPGAERRAVWQEHRARNWQSEHRSWRDRGGYDGYRISRSHYRSHFGPSHAFRLHRYPVRMVGGFINFQFGGFGFNIVDPLPEYWSESWYDNDDVYVSGSGEGYYLHNRRHPQDRIAIRVDIH